MDPETQFTICLIFFGAVSTQAQLNPDKLIGYWRQDALTDSRTACVYGIDQYISGQRVDYCP